MISQRVSSLILFAIVLSACGPMPGADGGTGGGGGIIGAGGGVGSGGGSGGGGGTLNCQSRCEAHFGPCGVNPTAGCMTLCASLTEAQLTCIEAQTCADDPGRCTSSNTGGGSGGGSGGGTGGGSGGGGGNNACAIPHSALKVSLPHFSSRVVSLFPGSNCPNNAGYNWVWNSRAFVDVTTSSQAAIHAAGSLYAIEYRFEQRVLSSSDRSAIFTETGIPTAALNDGDFMSRTSLAPVVIDGLPNDVIAQVQVTSNSQPSIQFVSSSQTALGTLKSRLDGPGVLVNVELSTMNGSYTRVAEFELKGATLKLLMLRL